ncbi:MAG: PIN domain-containing protein [Acidobacteria bacterium]|nr:PIN domain-containing protein [Acidobacteriota bacterium]MCW5970369.1 PIN domain-containing protein [Blastocatellales bacterium]
MPYLIDTNILVCLATPSHPNHAAAFSVTDRLIRNDIPYIVPQNIIEFWSVATRSADKNGLGMTAVRAEAEIVRIKNLFRLLPDSPLVYPEWERLVIRYGVIGKQVHDTRLVAAMLVHGLTRILTFNVEDFKRFPSITAVSP